MYNLFDKIVGKSLLLLIAMWLVCFHNSAYSQGAASDVDFTCFVTDQWGNPISDVNVSVKNSDYTTKSSVEGTFEVKYKIGDVLKLSHPNYAYREVKIDKRASKSRIFRITLSEKFIKNPDKIQLAYKEVDRKSYLGSSATVYTDQLTTTLSSTIIPALAGRMAGLEITQTNGTRSHNVGRNNESVFGAWIPKFGGGLYSDNSQFGVSSRNNAPVVIIDGVQRELFSLDPESIESVSIQKDALSSMALGMRSSRGALVITTKKPISEGFQLSFTAKYGVQEPIKKHKPLSAYQYSYLLNEALQNDGKQAVYSYNDFEAYRTGSSPYTHPDVNWYDQTMRESAAVQSYNLNVSGGGKVAQFFVSMGYFGEDGLFRSDKSAKYDTNLDSERYTIMSKVNVNVTKDFKVAATLMGRIEDGTQPGAGYSGILNNIYQTPNNAYPVYNANGTFGGSTTYPQNLYDQVVNSGYMNDNARDVMGTINLNYDLGKFLKGLSASGVASISSQSRTAIKRFKQSSVQEFKPAKDGRPEGYTVWGQSLSQSNDFLPISNYQYAYGQIALNYERDFGYHHLVANLQADTRNVTHNYDLPDRPGNIMVSADYDYKKKYFAQAAFTRSYYNGYHPDRQWGSFYAFGLGWDISGEEFMQDVKWVNQLKLRGVFGQTGNGIDNTGYYTWRQSFSGDGASAYELGTTRSNGTGLQENSPLSNPFLTWEKAHKFSVGIDAEMFDNKLSATLDYYNDKYYDLLQSRGKSIELIGQSYPSENIGKVRQHGFEVSLTYQDRIGKFNYFVTGNWSLEQSKLLFIDEQDIRYDYNRITGRPAGVNMGLIADGFFTSMEEIASSPKPTGVTNIRPGDIKYRDMNNDGVINDFDKTAIGGEKPNCYFGLNFGFEYCGFDFSMLWQGAYNRVRYLGDAVLMSGFQSKGQNYGQAYEHMLGRWTPETASTATLPRLSAGGNTYNMMYSSFWMKSGNYIRLKNVSLGYTLPESISRNYLGGVKMKVFVNGENLFTQSACDLVDPEVGFTNYPLMRCINVGVNLKF